MSDEKYEFAGYHLRLFLYRKRWAIEIKKGSVRKIKSIKTKDLKKAKEEFYKYVLELQEKGRLKILFDTNIHRQIEIFLEWSEVNSKSPRTYRRHKETLKKFSDFVTKNRIKDLSSTCYEKFKIYLLDKKLSPRTVDIHLTTLGKMITVLEDMDTITKGFYPRPKLIRPKKATAPQFWTKDEIDSVLKESEGRYIRGMIIFGLNTGLRRSELIHLRWEDVNFNGSFILVQGYEINLGNKKLKFEPKDHEIRRIKLNQEAINAILQLRGKSHISPFVFANKFGKPRANNIDRDLRDILKRVGVEHKGTWHAIRRSFATHLIMEGADLESVRQLLGHSEIKTTMAYLNVTSQHLDKTVDLLSFGSDKDSKKVVPFRKKG